MSVGTESTGILLERWKAGDKEAGNELYGRLQRGLQHMARRDARRLGNHALDSEDAAHSVLGSFFRLVRESLFSFRGTAQMWAFLRKHMKRRVIPRGRPTAPLLDEDEPPDRGHAFERAIDDGDWLSHLMRRLKPFSREVALLIVREYRMGEIVAELNSTHPTVRKALARIRAVLPPPES